MFVDDKEKRVHTRRFCSQCKTTGSIKACDVEEKFTTKRVFETCSTIKGGGLAYGKVSGYVVNVLFRKNMTFSVCKSCQRYVPRALGRCGRCQGCTDLLPVARVTLALMDDTGTLVLTLYGKVAESFLGMPVCCRGQTNKLVVAGCHW